MTQLQPSQRTGANGLATEQALQALVAYDLFTKGEGPLYRFPNQEAPVTANVTVTVEGLQGPVASGEAKGADALAALESLLKGKSVAYVVTESSAGSYVSSIDGITAGYLGVMNGWMFAVKRGDQLIIPDVGMAAFKLESNDNIVVYYGATPIHALSAR